MNSHAPYDTLRAYRRNNKLILSLTEKLSDEQLRWKPVGYNNSIGFNLWHIARWSDHLAAEILKEFPELGTDSGQEREIWVQESLGKNWGLPPVLHSAGTGLSDRDADDMIFPGREELMAYLRKTFLRTEEVIRRFDERYPVHAGIPQDELRSRLSDVRWNLYSSLMHDCRHLGMIEALKGLLASQGSAAA